MNVTSGPLAFISILANSKKEFLSLRLAWLGDLVGQVPLRY
jgi:hypothetical protein